MKTYIVEKNKNFFQQNSRKPFPLEFVKKASEELDHLSKVLKQEGVTVRRPVKLSNEGKKFETPDFASSNMQIAIPRDLLLVIGNEIIEAPMAWRSRFFEYRLYRPLLKEYFDKGAKWTTAPKPLMSDDLYDLEYAEMSEQERHSLTLRKERYMTTEHEPCFDAADFWKAGKDIFVQRSQVYVLSCSIM